MVSDVLVSKQYIIKAKEECKMNGTTNYIFLPSSDKNIKRIAKSVFNKRLAVVVLLCSACIAISEYRRKELEFQIDDLNQKLEELKSMKGDL